MSSARRFPQIHWRIPPECPYPCVHLHVGQDQIPARRSLARGCPACRRRGSAERSHAASAADSPPAHGHLGRTLFVRARSAAHRSHSTWYRPPGRTRGCAQPAEKARGFVYVDPVQGRGEVVRSPRNQCWPRDRCGCRASLRRCRPHKATGRRRQARVQPGPSPATGHLNPEVTHDRHDIGPESVPRGCAAASAHPNALALTGAAARYSSSDSPRLSEPISSDIDRAF